MIKFEGEISKACRKYIFGCYVRFSLFPAILVEIVIGVPVVVLLINRFALPWYLILITVALFLAFGVAIVIPSSKDLNKTVIPKDTTIEDGQITVHCIKFEECMPVERVTKVFDLGEWYHISFGIIRDQGRMVCQKDLMVQGTIQEFEALFEGKIVRK